ncbi:MAG: alpha-amylase family glycosyl hydrolase [Ilumatobacteraceae bacterium]
MPPPVIVDLTGEAGTWSGSFDAETGDHYWLTVDGCGPLLDPHCLDLEMTAEGPRSVVRDAWDRRPQGAPLDLPEGVTPVVYEVHVRGLARTFSGMIEHLDYIAALGVNVIELMTVHPFDDAENYWGYMPLVWGAVHRAYAQDVSDAAGELAELIGAAHDRGLHVWLDVVFNHTGEGDATLPTLSLRGIDDANAYRHRPDGSYTDDSGCGNDTNPADPEVRRLVLEALDRFADLGIDGFRFDLASLLGRDGGGLIAQISKWAAGRNVQLIAEPWDLAAYELGDAFAGRTWMQWNDKVRDQVRGFVRAEPGLVPAMMRRLAGSPDVFGQTQRSVNFVTAHDGFTMYDLTIVTDDHHHSWACGESLQMQQLKNYFALLLLSAGTPMFSMGDEFARTQHGNPNPYNIDSELTWVDWTRLEQWQELHDFVRDAIRLRRECPPVRLRFYGVAGAPDESFESRSLAFATDQLYVMVNPWWEPLHFVVQEHGDWQPAFSTASEPFNNDGWAAGETVAPRSIRVLRR